MDRSIYLSPIDLRSLGRTPDATEGALDRGCLGSGLTNKPVAYLFRQIATPSFELLWFVRRVKLLGFEPVILEHTSDRFSVHNTYKRSLISLPIVTGRGRDGRIIWNRMKIANHDEVEGQALNSIVLRNGENLVSFHHRMLGLALGNQCPSRVNLATIVSSAYLGAAQYYRDLMELLIGNFVLFEDFVVDNQTLQFFQRVVSPAFEEVVERTGFRPKVGRLIYGQRAALPLWNSYPSRIASESLFDIMAA